MRQPFLFISKSNIVKPQKAFFFKKVEKYQCRKMNSVENVELFITDEGKELLLHFYERGEK